MTAFVDYLPLLGLTILVELGIAMILCRTRRGTVARDLILLNLVSHPLATWCVSEELLTWTTAEILVVALEAAGYAAVTRLPWRRALLLACACKAVTAALSYILPG